jgi:GDPmannose 4,6-dehydratase
VLLGDPTKAQRVLLWKAEIDFPSLVKMMVDHDLEPARRERFARGYRLIPNRRAGW